MASRFATWVSHNACRALRRLQNATGCEGGAVSPFLTFAPPGHFYSPIPADEDIQIEGDEPVQDIELNEEAQKRLLLDLSRYYEELPFPENRRPDLRYYFDQQWYCYADAIYLYSLIRHFSPRRYFEIGSGFSSAVALDTSDLFLSSKMRCTFIEPYPERLRELLRAEDWTRCRLDQKRVQDVPTETFGELESNDILFVDSSHVCKVGSDVNHLVFNVLPRLKPGVLIHFHDILYPFEYPEAWFREGRAWNEAYLIRAFLQNNPAYEILLFGSYVARRFQPLLEHNMPLCLKNTGGALWLQKVR
jgi:hypothetical protein